MMGRMTRIQEGEDVVELSTRDRMHVEVNKVVVVCCVDLGLLNMSHDHEAKYDITYTTNIDFSTCEMRAKKL